MGYSDTTINHFMMFKAGIVSYYGPSIMAEFAENVEMHEYTKDAINNVLFNSSRNYKIVPSKQWTSESLSWSDKNNMLKKRKMFNDNKGFEILQGPKIVEGVLIGGCIDTFHMMIGSEIWPENWENKILFLESSEDKPTPEFIAQILRHPNMKKALQAINGIIIGKPVDETFYDEYKEIYLKVINDEYQLKDLFIGYNYNFGHTAPMCILPMGIKVKINSDDGIIEFLDSATKEEL